MDPGRDGAARSNASTNDYNFTSFRVNCAPEGVHAIWKSVIRQLSPVRAVELPRVIHPG